jgi:hypothetical protein
MYVMLRPLRLLNKRKEGINSQKKSCGHVPLRNNLYILCSQATHITFICPMLFDSFPLDTQICKFQVYKYLVYKGTLQPGKLYCIVGYEFNVMHQH